MPDRPPPPLAPIPHYRLEDWGGHELYTCNDCPWDTLDDKDFMAQHQEAAHSRGLITTAAEVERAMKKGR